MLSLWSLSYLQLCLKEELLGTLGAVVDLVFLSVHRKDVLLKLIGLDKHWGRDKRRRGQVIG